MQMFLQIHLWSCWQFLSTALFGRWWCWHLFSIRCPAQNGAHCFLPNWVGTLSYLTQRGGQFVSIPCRKWFLLLVLPDHLCVNPNPVDTHSCSLLQGRPDFTTALDSEGWECHVVWLWKLCHKFRQWIPSWDCFGSWWLSCLFCLSENFCEVIFNIFECPYCTKRHLCHKGKSSSISQRILQEKPAFTEDLGVGLSVFETGCE